MFMYIADGQKAQSTSTGILRKSQLTQRVSMPQNYASPVPKTETSPSQPQRSTPLSGPPSCCLKLPQGSSCPPTTSAKPSEIKVEASNESVSIPEDICDTSMAKLTGVFQKCQQELKARVADDIKKRLGMLEDAWNSGKLSTVVQQRMAKLATALADRDYGTAHELHLSLMVDYVSEVSQWMVGIKRLIMEARTALAHGPLETSRKDDSGPHDEDNKEMKPNDETNLGSQKTKTGDPEPITKDASEQHDEDNKEMKPNDEPNLGSQETKTGDPGEPITKDASEQCAVENGKQGESSGADNEKLMKPIDNDSPRQLANKPDLGLQESKTEDLEPIKKEDSKPHPADGGKQKERHDEDTSGLMKPSN